MTDNLNQRMEMHLQTSFVFLSLADGQTENARHYYNMAKTAMDLVDDLRDSERVSMEYVRRRVERAEGEQNEE